MKLIVEIDLHNHTLADYEADKDAWFPVPGHPELVSVDVNYLQEDPTDESFVVFKFVEAKE